MMGILGDWCPKCRTYHQPGRHLPTWRVMLAEQEEDAFNDWTLVRAVDAESAAERYVQIEDAYDCCYDSLDEPQRVVVKNPDSTETSR